MTTLKRIRGAKEAPAKKTKNPVVEIPGTLVQQLLKAKAALDQAKKDVEKATEELKKTGSKAVFEHNVAHPTAAISTAQLVDTTNSACNVSVKNQYPKVVDEVLVGEILEELGVEDINDWIYEAMVAKFDTSIFSTEDGKFRRKLYNEIVEAIATIAEDHGIDNPLTSEKVVKPKPNVHELRYALLPTVADQERFQDAIPATVSATAVKPKKK